MRRKILIVDDDADVRLALSRMLAIEGHEVEVAADGDAALDQLASIQVDGVLMDVNMPGRDGIDTLEAMRNAGHAQPVVIMSGEGTIEVAVRAVRQGAFDFVEKPIRKERLLVSLENALRCATLESRCAMLQSELGWDHELLGASAPIMDVKRLLAKAAPSEARVLITGENGTGKELVARAIHAGSQRSDQPFIKLNCAAVPSELIESELFGHERGAFTGAVSARKGKFELAHGGTLLLDEIGDMPPMMQAKLLRVLQEGELEVVGSQRTKTVDVRVLAATNRDLDAMVDAGEFRQDLYFRLNVVSVHVPPLRERTEDIPELVERFLSGLSMSGRAPIRVIRPDALRQLASYRFPGNVRELKNLVERMVILADGDELVTEDVERAISGGRSSAPCSTRLFRSGASLRELVADAEREIIAEALEMNEGKMTETARSLGLERSHLYKKLRILGVVRQAS